MENKVFFYDPHPGFAGAEEWLSPEVGAVADELEDTIGTISGAIEMIKAAAPEGARVSDHPTHELFYKPEPLGHGMICMEVGEFGKLLPIHKEDMLIKGNSWRVLRYKPIKDE